LVRARQSGYAWIAGIDDQVLWKVKIEPRRGRGVV
jgi:hypothetical protein